MQTNVENLYGILAKLQEGAPVLVEVEGKLVEADVIWDYVLQRDDGTWVYTMPGMPECVRAVIVR